MLLSNNISAKCKAVSVRPLQNSEARPLVYTLTAGNEIVCHDPNDNMTPDRVYPPEDLALAVIRINEQLSTHSVDARRHLANPTESIMADLIDLVTYIIKPALEAKRQLAKSLPILANNRWSLLNSKELEKL